MSAITKAADALRADPLFTFLSEDEQWDAARTQLSVEGVIDLDPIDLGTTVMLARQAKKPLGLPRQGQPKAPPPLDPLAPPPNSLLGRLCAAAPYSHREIADVLGCSRSLVTQYITGAAPEKLSAADRHALAQLARNTVAGLQAVLPALDGIG